MPQFFVLVVKLCRIVSHQFITTATAECSFSEMAEDILNINPYHRRMHHLTLNIYSDEVDKLDMSLDSSG